MSYFDGYNSAKNNDVWAKPPTGYFDRMEWERGRLDAQYEKLGNSGTPPKYTLLVPKILISILLTVFVATIVGNFLNPVIGILVGIIVMIASIWIIKKDVKAEKKINDSLKPAPKSKSDTYKPFRPTGVAELPDNLHRLEVNGKWVHTDQYGNIIPEDMVWEWVNSIKKK